MKRVSFQLFFSALALSCVMLLSGCGETTVKDGQTTSTTTETATDGSGCCGSCASESETTSSEGCCGKCAGSETSTKSCCQKDDTVLTSTETTGTTEACADCKGHKACKECEKAAVETSVKEDKEPETK